MAISGIGSNSFFDYNSSVNQVKLQQALKKAGTKYVDKKNAEYNKTDSLSDSMKFVKSYNSTMSDLMSSSNKLRDVNSKSVWNDLKVSSSDAEVLTASESYSLKGSSGNTYEVDVQQLAASQTNVSTDFVNTEKAVADASLTINSGGKSATINISKTDANGVEKTNKQFLQEMAKEINNSDTGVKATLVEKNGKTSIKLAGNTGEANDFTVSGDFADSSGLQNVTQAAKNAEYTVKSNDGSERSYSTDSNKISLEYGKISASLKSTGTSTVSVGSDDAKVVSAVEDLVKSYNSSLKLLNDNAERGSGVTRQLKSLLTGPSSEKSMKLVGITVNKDGTLALDKDKLTESLKRDSSLAKDIIGGSFGIAQNTFSKGSSGLSAPSSNLINYDIELASLAKLEDPINFMNMYTRRGAYNMMNYSAVGVMLNMYV